MEAKTNGRTGRDFFDDKKHKELEDLFHSLQWELDI
jgi:hypothetical protein